MVAVCFLSVQRPRHINPACRLVDNEKANRWPICPRPGNAVEELAVFILVRFDLGEKTNVKFASFFQNGFLVPCVIAISLGSVCNVSCQEQGVKAPGKGCQTFN